MKAKRGGYVDENRLQTLFADDPAMQAFLDVDCQKKFLIGTLNQLQKEALTNKEGGMPTGKKRGRGDEESSDDDLEEQLQQLPVEGSKATINCSPVQKIIAILLSICIELGAIFIGKTLMSMCFRQEMDAISSIVIALKDALYTNVQPAVAKTFLAGILGAFYMKKKDLTYANILEELNEKLKKAPFFSKRYNAIMERANKLCNSGWIPVGRSLTLEILRVRIANTLKNIGVGPEAEEASRRGLELLKTQLEIAKESDKQKLEEQMRQEQIQLERMRRGEIPVVPTIGGPSGVSLFKKPKKTVTLKEELKKAVSIKINEKENLRKKLNELKEELDGIIDEQEALEEALESRKERIKEEEKDLYNEQDSMKKEDIQLAINRFKLGESQFMNRLRELRREQANIEKQIHTIEEDLFAPLEGIETRQVRPEEFLEVRRSVSRSPRRSPSRSPSPSKPSKKKTKRETGKGGGKRRTHKKHQSSKTHKKSHGKKHYRKSRRS